MPESFTREQQEEIREQLFHYGTVVNLIKSIYAMREHRAALVEESLDNGIEMVLRMLEIYVSGKGELI